MLLFSSCRERACVVLSENWHIIGPLFAVCHTAAPGGIFRGDRISRWAQIGLLIPMPIDSIIMFNLLMLSLMFESISPSWWEPCCPTVCWSARRWLPGLLSGDVRGQLRRGVPSRLADYCGEYPGGNHRGGGVQHGGLRVDRLDAGHHGRARRDRLRRRVRQQQHSREYDDEYLPDSDDEYLPVSDDTSDDEDTCCCAAST